MVHSYGITTWTEADNFREEGGNMSDSPSLVPGAGWKSEFSDTSSLVSMVKTFQKLNSKTGRVQPVN